MSSLVSKFFKRSTLMFASFVLAISSLSAAMPLFLNQTASALGATHVTSLNPQGWSSTGPYAETRAGSTVTFATDSTVGTTGNGALRIVTNSSTTTKAQFMKSANNLSLSSVTGALGYSTKQNSAPFAGADASYQIQVFLNQDGPGTGYATLGYEPYVNHGTAAITKGVWQNWDVKDGLFYSSKTIAGVDGGVIKSQGEHTYTLDQIKTYFPYATVIAYGLNVGSNNPSYNVEADNFTFNGVTYDFEAIIPTIAITPAANSVLHGTGNTTFTVTSDTTAPAWMYVELNHQGKWIAANNGGGNSTSLTYNTGSLAEGTYTIKVDAFESNGNSQEKFFNFIVDHTAPTNVVVSPIKADGSSVVNGVIPFSVSASDPNYSYSYLEVNKNGVWITDNTHGVSSYNGSTLNWNWDSSTVPDGVYTLKADAVDKAGNTTERNINFTVDNTAPAGLMNLSPFNDIHTTTAHQTQITWHFASDIHGPVTYYYESSLSADTNPDGSFKTPAYGPISTGTDTFINTPNTPAGTYFWHVRAVDALGNSTAWTDPWTIFVDNTAPTASFIFPTPGPSAKSFQVVYSEDVNQVDATNAANYFLNNWPGTMSFSSLAGHATVTYEAATHTATVTFTDSAWYVSAEQQWGVKNIHDLAGNALIATTGLSSELVAPGAPGVPTATSPSSHSNVVWTWTAAVDPGNANASGVSYYEYNVDNTGWAHVAGTTVTTTGLTDGSHTLSVRAVDRAGNVGAEATGMATVDTKAPVVHVNAINTATNPPAITGTVDDPTAIVTVTLNGTPLVVTRTGTTTWSANVPDALADGSYEVVATATDPAGNFTKETVPMTVATTTTPTANPLTTSATPTAPVTTATTGTPITTTGTTGQAVLGAQTTTPADSNNSTNPAKDVASILGDSTTKTNNIANIFGLAWYWWVLILAALAAIIWWIIAAMRRRQNQAS